MIQMSVMKLASLRTDPLIESLTRSFSALAELQGLIVQMVQDISGRFPDVTAQTLQTLAPEVVANLSTCVSACNGAS